MLLKVYKKITASKVSKYGIISSPCFFVFGLNTEIRVVVILQQKLSKIYIAFWYFKRYLKNIVG